MITRVLRVAVLSVVLGSLVAGGVAIGSVLAAGDSTARVPDPNPAAGTASMEVRANDPHGNKPWGVTVYKGVAGDSCAAATQLDARGNIGFETEAGFRQAPLEDVGSCFGPDVLPASDPLDTHIDGRVAPGGSVAMVWGVALPSVVRITAKTPVGSATMVPSSRGAFIAVWKGSPEQIAGQTTVTAELKDGTVTTKEFSVPAPPKGLQTPEEVQQAKAEHPDE
jgi:hypothetical protein